MGNQNKIEVSFTSATTSNPIAIFGYFNLSLSGFGTATVKLQRSFDKGTTWKDVTDGSFTANVEKQGYEPEEQVYYRLNCSAYTSGTILGRLSQ